MKALVECMYTNNASSILSPRAKRSQEKQSDKFGIKKVEKRTHSIKVQLNYLTLDASIFLLFIPFKQVYGQFQNTG